VAKKTIPDPLKRRHLIEQDLSAADSLAIADAYLEAGRVSEAVAFLVKAEAEEQLAALVEQAVGEGDAFLLKELADATGEDPGTARWQAAASAAEAAGKQRYAEMARRHALSSEQ